MNVFVKYCSCGEGVLCPFCIMLTLVSLGVIAVVLMGIGFAKQKRQRK